jgi:uncharacterized membrane-anchored protein YitT (DUF2179 family)
MADTQPVTPVAHGMAVFAGVIMIIGGAFQAVEALAAIVNDKYLVVLPEYIYAFDLTLWGWIHLLVGLGLLAIGIFLLRGATWARMAGIVVAVISAIVNFAWLPYSPWWALMVIAIDVLIIWALTSYLRQPDLRSTQQAARQQGATPQTTS